MGLAGRPTYSDWSKAGKEPLQAKTIIINLGNDSMEYKYPDCTHLAARLNAGLVERLGHLAVDP